MRSGTNNERRRAAAKPPEKIKRTGQNMKFTKSNAKKFGRKGGNASAEKRRKKFYEFADNPDEWTEEKWRAFVKKIKGETA